MPRGSSLIVSATLCANLWAGGCTMTTGFDYPADLASKNYVQRTGAAREFARRKDSANADRAFALLNDDHVTLRVLAHSTLRDLSDGEDFGYRADLDEVDRWRVARRWQFWWENQRG